MPVDFLTTEREESYGRYVAEPSPADLARFFHLDDADRAVLADRRGDHNRLGFGLQLCTLRYLGVFLDDPTAVPPGVAAALAAQLGVADLVCLDRYRVGETRWDHAIEIRRRYGYRAFEEQPGHLRLVRWLYARAWLGEERPSALFEAAVARLMARKIILPGVSVLERLVARVRDRAAARLWRRLAMAPDPAQRAALERLLLVTEEGRQTPLDRLRRGPTTVSSVTLVAAVRRLEEIRAVGVGGLDLAGVPPGRVRALARYALAARAQAVSRMPDDRRVAALLAAARVLEVAAHDDVVDVLDTLIDDLIDGAARVGKRERLRTLRDLDAAALLLRDVALIVRDPRYRDADLRDAIGEQHGDGEIDLAVATVSALTRSPDDHYQRELMDTYPTIRRFLPAALRALTFHGTAASVPLREALDFLRALDGPHPPDVVEAPLAVVPPTWRDRVVGVPYRIDRTAYTAGVLEQFRAALRRRDLYIAPSERWADPRAKLLSGPAWEASRPQVCRALGHELDPTAELAALGRRLDDAYRRTAANLDGNTAVRIERQGGRDTLVLSPLDKLDEPPSLRRLRAEVDVRLPHLDLPELLLEIHGVTGFADAFTHLSEGNARAEGLATSVCAVLLADACNIGLRAVARPDVPALTLDRLAWVRQNYVREETLAAANARLVDYHATLPLAKAWGGGEVASVDGLRFRVPVKTLNAGTNPKYFGWDRGATWLNAASDMATGLGGEVVAGTLRDSGRILDVILGQHTSVHPVEVMADTAAYSDIVFSLFALLGLRFSPRLADIGEARFWRIDPRAHYGGLNGIARQRIRTDLIAQHWDDLLRMAGSLQTGTVSASEMMRTLQSDGRYSALGRAAAEYGRIAKTLYLLEYIDDAGYRRRVLVQLNRQEERHRVARAVFYGQKGELRQHYQDGQEDQLGALGLVVNALVLWNTRYTQRVIDDLQGQGWEIEPADLARLSPLGFEHITILGRYQFAVPASVLRGEFRPLRTPDGTDRHAGRDA